MRPNGHPREAIVGNHIGRLTAAEQPCQAIRAAFQCPYPELRRAAMAVLRKALLSSDSIAEAARKLGVEYTALTRLKKDFPEQWLDAQHRVSSNLAKV